MNRCCGTCRFGQKRTVHRNATVEGFFNPRVVADAYDETLITCTWSFPPWFMAGTLNRMAVEKSGGHLNAKSQLHEYSGSDCGVYEAPIHS